MGVSVCFDLLKPYDYMWHFADTPFLAAAIFVAMLLLVSRDWSLG
jgi:ABC-type uncharacterized transport system permease subunit